MVEMQCTINEKNLQYENAQTSQKQTHKQTSNK